MNIAERIIRVADILDTQNKFEEADALTKIASEISINKIANPVNLNKTVGDQNRLNTTQNRIKNTLEETSTLKNQTPVQASDDDENEREAGFTSLTTFKNDQLTTNKTNKDIGKVVNTVDKLKSTASSKTANMVNLTGLMNQQKQTNFINNQISKTVQTIGNMKATSSDEADKKTGERDDEDNDDKEAISLTIKSFYAEAFVNGLPIVTTGRYRTMYEVFSEPRLRALREEFGYDLGTAKFVEEIDSSQSQYVANLITDSTVDNRFGFNSSDATLEGIYPNQELLNQADKVTADQSLIGTLFNQGDFNEDRSDIASDILYNIRINGKPVKYTSDEAFNAPEDLQVRAGNKDYYAGIEVIEQHARERGINKGTKAYEEYYGIWKKNWEDIIGKKYPIWSARDETIRQNRVEKNLSAAQLIVSNSNYMSTVGSKNPMALATAEYLRGRKTLQKQLAIAIENSGNTTIDASKNAYVAELRDNYVKALDAKYPGFQRVHDIYFNNDKLNDIAIYETGYGFGGTE